MDYRLIQGDCLAEMEELHKEGAEIDLIITDPPYLMNYKTNYRKNKDHKFCTAIKNDNNPELIKRSLEEMYKLLKVGGACYCFCNANQIDFFKKTFQEIFKFKNVLIWVKNNHTAGDLKGSYAKKTEFILFGTKGRHLLNGKRDTDVLFYDRVVGNKQVHQNQKPLDLLEFLITKSSKEGDTVFDPFMGSGSTGVSCMKMGRKFIGVELDEDFFEIARQRMER